jgi:hypothetical protein
MSQQLIIDAGIAVVASLLLLVPRITRSIFLESLLHPFGKSEFVEDNGRIQAVRR